MQNYIIISIIFVLTSLIIFLIYNKKDIKYNIIEDFNDVEVYSEESLNIITNLEKEYNKTNTIATFKNINSSNLETKSINNRSIIKLDVNTTPQIGDILRYYSVSGDETNAWVNSSPMEPEYLSLIVYGTPLPLEQKVNVNLLLKTSYANHRNEPEDLNLNSNELFNFEGNKQGTQNKYYTFNCKVDPATRPVGLKYDIGRGKIIGFDPKKIYRIDCTISFYKFPEDGNDGGRIMAFITKGEGEADIIARTYLTVWRGNSGLVLRLGGFKEGIPKEGIGIYIQNLWTAQKFHFRGYEQKYAYERAWYPAANITVLIEELRRGI